MSLDFFSDYANRLNSILSNADWHVVSDLSKDLLACWNKGNRVFICGNGGSAGNAIHLANDFIYGVAKEGRRGIKATSLNDNMSIMTCFANDIGYESVFSKQLAVLGSQGDILITLSGSGNSSNIISVINQAKKQEIISYAIVGYDGGECKEIADKVIHFDVNDMQISEDTQLIVGHMLMQWLYKNQKEV